MNFIDYISGERERLDRERQQVQDQMAELNEKRNAIDRELAAIAAYDDAKNGRVPPQRGENRGGPGRRRAPRGSKRTAIMSVIREAGSTGLKRGEILERMGLKGDKAGEMSVSNALTALLKATQVERHEGKYVVI